MTDILDYIEARSPQGAENVKRRLKAAIDLLANHPKSGPATNKGDLRRLVANPYPYVIFYPNGRDRDCHSRRSPHRPSAALKLQLLPFLDIRYVII